jgi:hypothetical protein
MGASTSPSKSPSLSPSLSPSASVSPSPSAATAEAGMMREYGYRVTGDTGKVTVTTKRIYVKSFILTGAAAVTAIIVNADDDAVIVITQDTGVAGGSSQIGWENRIDGLRVTLSSTSAVLNIIVG